MAIHAAFTIDVGEETDASRGLGHYWTWANEAERQSGKYTFEILKTPLGSWRQYISVSNQALPKDGETFTLRFRQGGLATYSSDELSGVYKAMSLTELRKTKPKTEPFDITDGLSGQGIAAGRINNNIGVVAKPHGDGVSIVQNANPNLNPSMSKATGLYALKQSGSGASRVFIYADTIAEFGTANNAAAITNAIADGNTAAAEAIAKADPEAAKKAGVPSSGSSSLKSQAVPAIMGLGGAGAIGYAALAPAGKLNGRPAKSLRGLPKLSTKRKVIIGVGAVLVVGAVVLYNTNEEINKKIKAGLGV